MQEAEHHVKAVLESYQSLITDCDEIQRKKIQSAVGERPSAETCIHIEHQELGITK